MCSRIVSNNGGTAGISVCITKGTTLKEIRVNLFYINKCIFRPKGSILFEYTKLWMSCSTWTNGCWDIVSCQPPSTCPVPTVTFLCIVSTIHYPTLFSKVVTISTTYINIPKPCNLFTQCIIDCLCGLVVRVPGYRSGGPRFDSRALEEKKKVVGLERGPLSLVSTTEELLGSNSSGSGLESREYGLRNSLHWPRGTLYPQKSWR
jgi:hypothetical protein